MTYKYQACLEVKNVTQEHRNRKKILLRILPPVLKHLFHNKHGYPKGLSQMEYYLMLPVVSLDNQVNPAIFSSPTCLFSHYLPSLRRHYSNLV